MNNDTAFMILLISLVILCGLFVIGVAVQVTGDETRDNLCKRYVKERTAILWKQVFSIVNV